MTKRLLRAISLLLVLSLLLCFPVCAAELSWAQKLVGLSYAADRGITGEGVTVGIIDSGLSANFVSRTGITVAHATNYLVAEDHADRDDVTDNVGHGTAVASIIADPTIGLAPEVTLVPLKCFDTGTGSFAPIIEAVYDAVDSYGCDVINLSLGSTIENAELAAAVQHALDQGVIVVAAAGNCASTAPIYFYPASQEGVISVGAVDSTGAVIDTSARNDKITVAAPGRDVPIFSSTTSAYTIGGGTSYAAPFVAATAALALSVEPNLTPAAFMAMLQQTAHDGGTSGYDTAYGHGLLNIPALLSDAQNEPSGVFYDPLQNAVTIQVEPIQTVESYSLFLVFYGGDGRLISMKLWQGLTEPPERLSIPLPDGCTECKLLVVDPDFSPLLGAAQMTP